MRADPGDAVPRSQTKDSIRRFQQVSAGIRYPLKPIRAGNHGNILAKIHVHAHNLVCWNCREWRRESHGSCRWRQIPERLSADGRAPYQSITAAEPLNLPGWQLVDELNRAMQGKEWSGYTSPLQVVTADNIAFDGGDRNIFDPDNGYRGEYGKIWGK